MRAIAWGLLVAGVAAPALRRRLKLSPAAVLSSAAVPPLAVCVLYKRSTVRDVVVVMLNMWAYVAAYEMPHDDPEWLAARVRLRYPIAADRALGLGVPPTVRLQHTFGRPGEIRRFERFLAWCHWLWFAVPHGSVAYMLWVDRDGGDRLTSAAARMYAVFDLGAVFYWAVPTAPPWWAAQRGELEDGEALAVRRMMIEYGRQFWGRWWPRLFKLLGGNPLAAMPSLHFATSAMAAIQLTEAGPVEGAVGWTYSLTLGFALVYLGEHYVTDLLAGAGLVAGVRRGEPLAEPAVHGVTRGLQRLERLASG